MELSQLALPHTDVLAYFMLVMAAITFIALQYQS